MSSIIDFTNRKAREEREQADIEGYYKWFGQKQKAVYATASSLYELWIADGDRGLEPEELWSRAVSSAYEAVDAIEDDCF